MKKEYLFQMIKFTLFSISAGVIQVVTFALLNELFHWMYWPAYLVSLVISIIWNFTLNREYTFKSANNVPIAMAKLFGFYAVFTPLSTWLGHLADTAGINEFEHIRESLRGLMKYIVHGERTTYTTSLWRWMAR